MAFIFHILQINQFLPKSNSASYITTSIPTCHPHRTNCWHRNGEINVKQISEMSRVKKSNTTSIYISTRVFWDCCAVAACWEEDNSKLGILLGGGDCCFLVMSEYFSFWSLTFTSTTLLLHMKTPLSSHTLAWYLMERHGQLYHDHVSTTKNKI